MLIAGIRGQGHRSGGRQGGVFFGGRSQEGSLHAAHEAIEKVFRTREHPGQRGGGNDPKVTVTADMSFEKIGLADWQANFDLNVVGGVLLPCQEFGAAMVARGRGSIINIASVSAHIPLSRVVSYSAAKRRCST
jgi:hypothetical protein